MNHEDYMRRAIALALEVPEFPFGAVIVNRATGMIKNGSTHNNFLLVHGSESIL